MPEKPTYEELKEKVDQLKDELARQAKTVEELGRFVETSQDVIYRYDLGTNRFVLYNRAGRELYGEKEGEKPTSKSVLLSIYPEDRDRVTKAAQESLMSNRMGGEIEYRQIRADGSVRWMHDRWHVIRDESDRPIAIEGIVRDNTERKKAEEALRKSEKDLKASQRIAHLGSWHLDLTTNQVEWTEELYNMYGFDPTLPPPPYTEHMKLFTPESWEKLSAALARTSEKGIPYELELETVREDGTNGWMWVHGERENDSAGNTIGLWGAAQDITERKRAEEALRESEETVRKKLHAILEPEGDIGLLNLGDIVDHRALQSMMEEFYRVTKIGSAVLDLSGKVLVAVGWQDICTKFHRCHPVTLKNCLESDTVLSNGVQAGTFKAYRCKNNLWDMVTPIEVGGRHMGNIFLGQFFYEDEIPDYDLFRSQARQYGFDETEYLAALDRVPSWSRKTADAAMAFYAKLAGMISFLSYSTVNLSRALSQQEVALRQLGESEETHRTLVACLPDIVMRFDRDGRHLFVSANVSEAVDFQAAQFIGKTHRELALPEAQCRFWEEAIQRVFDSGSHFETEFTFEGKQGPAIHNCRLMPERDAQGAVRSVLSISRDITAYRKAERDYRTLFNEMLDGFALHEIICDGQGQPVDYRFLAVNPAFERMTGLKASHIVGSTVLQVMPGTERHWIETYGRVALTGELTFFENKSKELDRYFEVRAFRPAPNQFACIFADVTDRKRAEEALRESENRFRDLVEMLPETVFEADSDMNLKFANKQALSLFGYSKQDFDNGLNGLDMLVPEDRERASKNAGKRFHGEELGAIEYRGLRKDGSTFPILLHTNPITQQGSLKGFRGIIVDISERERMEAHVRQAQKMESVGRLAGGVAHDFNNMLGVILGRTEMALDLLDPAQPIHADLQEIRKAGERSADLTRQLLAFARKQTISPKVLDLNETVESMLKMLRRLIGEDIDLAWLPEAGLCPVKVDPAQIDQILANLCVNARDAIAGVGKVTVETRMVTFDEAYCADHAGFVPGEFFLLAISDNGCGMDKETLGSIFEPFFTTKGTGKGTGLGLATVHGIVKQNDGFINVYSEPGQGTTFRIYLPRHMGKAGRTRQEGPPEPTGHGSETILLVEDEPAILNITTMMLQRLGYTVLEASTPGEAIRLAREHMGEIDLLMTDVVMPEMNGRDLAKNLLSLYPNVKRLFMSGYTADVIAHHGVLDEGVHFIQKPFSKTDLSTKVREALRV